MTKADGAKSTWNRRYFVLTRSGNLFYYKTKSDYQKKPDAPIKDRPIELPLYDVSTSAFEIRLELKDKEELARVWVFRCDTEDELETWRGALQAASALLVR